MTLTRTNGNLARWLVAIGALFWVIPFATPHAEAAPRHAPICKPSQLRTTMSPSKGTYSRSAGFKATLWLENTGGTCSLAVDNVPVQAVFGPSHQKVGMGSLSGAVAYAPLLMDHRARAYANVWIGSTFTPSFKKLLRDHGGSCSPKVANGIEIVGNPAVPDDSWPSHYFALAANVPVCTKGYFNVASSPIEKSN